MMKYFVLAAFILMLNKGYCQLAVDKDSIDFGIVTDTTHGWRNIKILNTSATESITIHNIVTGKTSSAFSLSCPESLVCADHYIFGYPPVKDFTLLPGKSVAISVAYHKVVALTAPAPTSDELLLSYELQDHRNMGLLTKKIALHAFVIPPVIFSTDTVHLGVVKQGDSLMGKYYLVNHADNEQRWKVWTDSRLSLTVDYPHTVQPLSRDSVVFKLKTDSLCDHLTGVIRIQVANSKIFDYYDLFYEATIVNVKNYAAAQFDSETIYKKMPGVVMANIFFILRIREPFLTLLQSVVHLQVV